VDERLHGADEGRDIGGGMGRSQGDPEPRRAARDRRVADGGNENIVFPQVRRGGDRPGFIAQNQRYDRAGPPVNSSINCRSVLRRSSPSAVDIIWMAAVAAAAAAGTGAVLKIKLRA